MQLADPPERAAATTVKDRRARPRVSLSWRVTIRLERESVPVAADLRDISCQGAYCFTSQPFRCGEAVEIELLLPHELDPLNRGLRVNARGVVVRMEGIRPGEFGIACAFHDHTLTVAPAASNRATASAGDSGQSAPGVGRSAAAACASVQKVIDSSVESRLRKT